MKTTIKNIIENNHLYRVMDADDQQAWNDYCEWYDIDPETEDKNQAENFIEECYHSTAIDDGQEDAELEMNSIKNLPFVTGKRLNDLFVEYKWNGIREVTVEKVLK